MPLAGIQGFSLIDEKSGFWKESLRNIERRSFSVHCRFSVVGLPGPRPAIRSHRGLAASAPRVPPGSEALRPTVSNQVSDGRSKKSRRNKTAPRRLPGGLFAGSPELPCPISARGVEPSAAARPVAGPLKQRTPPFRFPPKPYGNPLVFPALRYPGTKYHLQLPKNRRGTILTR